MGSSKTKTKTTTKRARKATEPKPAAKTKRKGKHPLPAVRTTKRARHPKGPEQPATQVAEKPAGPVALVPGLHTRSGGRVTRRMTFYFPPALAERIEREAFEQRTSVSVLGQRIFEAHYAAAKKGAA